MLLFSAADKDAPWWEKLLHPHCAHVDILVMNPGHAVLMEPFAGNIRITDLELHTAKRLIDGWPGPVIESWPGPRQKSAVPFGPTTCVTLAKAIVGCGSWRVQTPHQLCRWVNENGGWWVATWRRT